VRDWLLAKGFPARTRPMGSTEISLNEWEKSYDMAVDFLEDSTWPREDRLNGVKEWRHGDFKDVAFPHVRELYKTWINLCE
jgi:hypothetical protein